MPRSFQWSLTFGPSNQNPVNTSPLSLRATCLAHLVLLDLITLKYSVKIIGYGVHHAIFTAFLFFRSKYPPQQSVFKNRPCSILKVRDQVSHP